MILTMMSYVGCVLSTTCCFLAIFIYSILQYVLVILQCVTIINYLKFTKLGRNQGCSVWLICFSEQLLKSLYMFSA